MADNDQMFDLLTKMYSEVQGIKSDISNMKSEINERFDSLENVVRKTNMTIE